jgi:hypothetical protein
MSVQSLKQTPLPADWNRFDIIATRIRYLSHDNERRRHNYPTINLDIFRCLKVHGKHIRHLRQLFWVELDIDIFPYVELFFGPNLVELSLDFPKVAIPGAVDLCSSIKNLSPNISTLELRLRAGVIRYIHQPSLPGFSSLACSFPQLTAIHVDFPVTAEAIKHLSLLPKLTQLIIPNDASEMLKSITDARLRRVFANLTILCLTATSPALCYEFLKLIRPVHLKFLIVHLGPDYISVAHDVGQMFVGVRDLCSHPQLERFSLDFGSNSGGQPLTPGMLEPLFVFRNLDLMGACTPFSDFDNASLKRLAIAWPNLSQLTLHTRPDGRDRSKVCLEGLAELVTRCPGLTYLTIELHISAGNLESWKKTHGDLSNNILWFLDLSRSTFHCDAGELAHSLHILFPELTSFYALDDEPGYSWNDVARHLGFSQAHY